MGAQTTLSRANPGRRPTLRDVAALAGVSYKTVSRVVNNEPGVSPALADRVRRASAQLDYHPNHTASSLRRGDRRTSSLGLILEDVGNPFSGAMYRAVEDVALARGVTVLAGSCEEDATRANILLSVFASRRVDGLIVAPPPGDLTPLLMEQRKGTALVFLDRAPGHSGVDAVVSDNRRGSARGVTHLIRHGHQRIGFLGDDPAIWTAEERFQGYVDAMTAHDLPIDHRIIQRNSNHGEARVRSVTSMLSASDPPTALFTGQNLVTMDTIRALRARGQEHETAMVGFDDFRLADLLEPAVTVIAQDLAAMGHRAAALVFERIDGAQRPFRQEVIPTRLIIRGSGEIVPT